MQRKITMDTMEKIEGLLRVWKDRADDIVDHMDKYEEDSADLLLKYDKGKDVGKAQTLYDCIAEINHILKR